jgi:hypothetical protein
LVTNLDKVVDRYFLCRDTPSTRSSEPHCCRGHS